MKKFLWDVLAVVGIFVGVGAVGIILATLSAVVVAVVVPLAFILSAIVVSVFMARGLLAVRRWRVAR
jgi:hypothetical protein